ncbi:MAG: cupin domain-containing protein [Candidatus Hodarchaeota archaeon]
MERIKIKRKKISFFLDVEKAPKFMQMEGLETTILTGLNNEKMMMALNATLPGYTVPIHSHKHEQVGMVYAGEAKLKIGDEEHIVKQGDFFCIPSNTPHSDTCIGNEPFVMLDIFYPSRKDFLKKLRENKNIK